MKKPQWLFLLLLFACTHQPKVPDVHIRLVNNNSAVAFTGIDPAIMGGISRDTASDIWENLIPVYKMPADTEMKDFQPVQHGLYKFKDSIVVFTPDTPFIKGKTYFMRYYQFESGTKPWDLMREKKKPGSTRYKDMVFVD